MGDEQTDHEQTDDGRTIVKLDHPIKFGKKMIEELSFRRGRLGDLKGVSLSQKPGFDEIIRIASSMCGQPTAIIEKLEGEDAEKAVGPALRFFAVCLGTGGSE